MSTSSDLITLGTFYLQLANRRQPSTTNLASVAVRPPPEAGSYVDGSFLGLHAPTTRRPRVRTALAAVLWAALLVLHVRLAAMEEGGPATLSGQPPPDLSHLTEEERRIIEGVMFRQQKEEEKEMEILRYCYICTLQRYSYI
ncbi:hypothetical protein JTE90_021775 [Oedothorax gibbosus]|uniref:Uncharacterized protein n=1 Tax=Oedothorax gibbosus TaxID=931172 RepID=A0AAV6USJ2_9ARAC|nr:hypothetical protein JTE90_021775 [Oedothorax gibbosus]